MSTTNAQDNMANMDEEQQPQVDKEEDNTDNAAGGGGDDDGATDGSSSISRKRRSSETAAAAAAAVGDVEEPEPKKRRSTRTTTAATTTEKKEPEPAAEGTAAAEEEEMSPAAAASKAAAAASKKKTTTKGKSSSSTKSSSTGTGSATGIKQQRQQQLQLLTGKKMNDKNFKKELLHEALQDAKEEFEKGKNAVLDQIPQKIKDMYGQIGFAKWNKAKLPVLIMNPYQVPPEPVRAHWFEMFNKVKENNRLDSMSYLVYWYGEENEKAMYSLIAQSSFIPYEQAITGKKKTTIIPAKAQRKIDTGKTEELSKQEVAKVRAQKEVDEDLAKEDPSDRRRGILEFKEGYETLKLADVDDALLDENYAAPSDDNDEIPDDDDDEDDDESSETDEASKKPAAPKKKSQASKKASKGTTKKKGRGSKKTALDDTAPDNDDEEREVVVTTKAAGKKKKASSKQKKSASQDDKVEKDVGGEQGKDDAAPLLDTTTMAPSVDMDDIGDADESDVDDEKKSDGDAKPAVATEKASKKKKGIKKAKRLEIEEDEAKPSVEDEVAAALAEEDQMEEKEEAASFDSNDFERDDSFDTIDEDLDDEDYEAQSKRRAKGQKKAAAKGKVAKKQAPVKKAAKTKHKSKEALEAQKIKAGKKQFRENEKKFAPLIESWDSACKAGDSGKVLKSLKTVGKELDNFCAKFIEEYGLSNLMKATKSVLKENDIPLGDFQNLRHALKAHYAKVQAKYPSFAVKKAPRRASNEAKAEPVVPKPPKAAEPVPDAGARKRAPEGEEVRPIGVQPEAPDAMKAPAAVPKKEGTLNIMAKKMKSPQKPVAKAEPKPKFTLKNLMRQNAKPAPSSTAGPLRAKSAHAAAAKEKAILPAWVSGPTSLQPPQDVARSYALSFLQQMAEHFPPGKINCESVAISVESAIFSWATKKAAGGDMSKENLNDKDPAIVDEYWGRVHAIVGGVCGKRDPGPLMYTILAGDFVSPKTLVEQPEEVFLASFEGKEIDLDNVH